jgi:hypothetical protein
VRKVLLLIGVVAVISALFASVACSQEVEPAEPEIVLPPVILELEDLSIERVTADLPGDEELLPPEQDFPLPEADELVIEEPKIELTLQQANQPAFQLREGKYLTTDAVLGIGTLNEFYSRLSLYYLGKSPEGKILYQHETVDGFSSEPPGTGHSIDEDRLEGFINFDFNRALFRLEGVFYDVERGLQEQGSFFSKINRFIVPEAELELKLGEHFSMTSSLYSHFTKQLLTGGTAGTVDIDEYSIGPSLTGKFQFDRGAFGLTPSYRHRDASDLSGFSLNRVQVLGFFEADITDSYRIEGSGGWYWSENTEHLFPFQLELAAVVSDFFSFSAGGGRRIEEFDLKDVYSDYPLTDTPVSLDENKEWFASFRAGWAPFQGWMIDGGLTFRDSSAMPDPEEAVDLVTGLFTFNQNDARRLSLDFGARWNISKSFTTRLGWDHEFLDKPEFYPRNKILFELNGIQQDGKFGGGLTSEFTAGVNDFVQLPVVYLSGFYRINDFLRFIVELDDVLYPLLEDDDPRFSWFPYVDPGFILKTKVNINF